MAWIYSAGMLEAEEVQEDMTEALAIVQNAGNNNWLFCKLTDEVGDPIVFQVPEIIKIRSTPL